MSLSLEFLQTMIVVAGVGQLVLVAVSPAIPFVLKWKEELTHVSDLTRRLFWVYAAYILCTNLAFGLLSAFAPHSLLDDSLLAIAVSGFMAVYWGSRLVIQFTCFGNVKPTRAVYRFAEITLVLFFVFLTFVYSSTAYMNILRLGL
jgi:hypothetical protein